MATTGADGSRRTSMVRPFARRVRTTVSDGMTDVGAWTVNLRSDEAGGGRIGRRLGCGRRAIGPRTRSGAIHEAGCLRRTAESHQGTTKVAHRGLVARIGLHGAHVKRSG